MIENEERMSRDQDMVDVVFANGTHTYWSTHCRHGQHDACQAAELAPGIPRRPAQCKTCAAPCVCACHRDEFAHRVVGGEAPPRGYISHHEKLSPSVEVGAQ